MYRRLSVVGHAVLILFVIANGRVNADTRRLRVVSLEDVGYLADEAGVWFSGGAGEWEPRSSGLPLLPVYPFDGSEYRPVNAIAVDPSNPSRVAIVTDSEIYWSDDEGKSWVEVSVSDPIRSSHVFTSVSIGASETLRLLVGTSFSGLFETSDGGKSWLRYSESLSFLYKGAGFYEELKAVAVSPFDPQHLVIAAGFGGGLHVSRDGGESFASIEVPGEGEITDVYFRISSTSSTESAASLFVQRDSGAFSFENDAWSRVDTPLPTPDRRSENPGRADAQTGDAANANAGSADTTRPMAPNEVVQRGASSTALPSSDDESEGFSVTSVADLTRTGNVTSRVSRIEAATGRSGIYVNSLSARGEKLEDHIDLLISNGMNALVVDMKDDAGFITYDTDLESQAHVDATRERFKLDELVRRVHDSDLYLVGRVVVFQDPNLYRFEDSAYAVWDEESDAPWGNLIPVYDSDEKITDRVQREFWVDPFSEEVWRYNLEIAEELERRGVDEIQFDYIRFPSDGPVREATYRHRRSGMSKADALESFLRLVRESVAVPIGIDIFGFNGWYRMGNWIGQSLPRLAKWVDVVSPMFYPSHYPRGFLPEFEYFERARVIYEEGSNRAHEISGIVVRPYVQAFLIGGERRYEQPEYTEYLRQQLEGVKSSKASGFLLWNASNNYYMVVDDLSEFAADSEHGASPKE